MTFERKSALWIFVFLVLDSKMVSGQNGQLCVMEGPCKEGDSGDLNCHRVRPPSPLNDRQAVKTLREICHELIPSDDSAVCCSPKQVEDLETNFLTASALIGRCPSCMENFKRIFCHFTCSPYQSSFVNITEVEKADDGQLVVKTVAFYLDYFFVQKAYDSCKGVQGLTPGSTAMELMCGSYGSDCSPQRWVDFMGSTPENGGFAPFQIDMLVTPLTTVNKTLHPFNFETIRCSEPAGKNNATCYCADCPAAC